MEIHQGAGGTEALDSETLLFLDPQGQGAPAPGAPFPSVWSVSA